MTQELARLEGFGAQRLFESELRKAVVRASNDALALQVTTTSIAGTGSALGDLQAGLAIAADSDGYVVAAKPAAVRELALQADGRMGVNGGDYLPGITVIPVPEVDSSTPNLVIYPASTFVLSDSGLVIRNSGEATIMLSDTPTFPGTPTSLWQTDSTAILVERLFRVYSSEPAIEVG